jgi:hydroxyacylglutathione hydrolase
MNMRIVSATGGLAQTNCFLIADEQSGQAVLFDAPDHTVTPVLDEAQKQKWDVIGLWLTHGHFDHLADHAEVTGRFPKATVLIHRLDEPKLMLPQSKMFNLPFRIPPRKADGYVEDGQEMSIGQLKVRVIHTPGHAPGHVSYYLPDEHVLVGGDLIIAGSIGRTDLPDSDPEVLFESIRKIMSLPPRTRLLPGHGPIRTLEQERQDNDYVRAVLGI